MSRSTVTSLAVLAFVSSVLAAAPACGDSDHGATTDDTATTTTPDATTTTPGDADAPDATADPCGDGRPDPGEACDDGVHNGEYGACKTDCSGLGPHCGDSLVDDDFEVCDDGPDNGAYGHCAAACNSRAPYCGNGFPEPEYGEACDDGDKNGTYGYCQVGCAAMGPFCGDSVTDEPYERCDFGPLNGLNDTCPWDCGGGDPGGTTGPSCGDGTIQKPERCDSGAALNGTYGHCLGDCSGPGPRCGDATLQAPEQCDDGAALNGQPSHCRADCTGVALPWTPGPGVSARTESGTCDPNDWLGKYLVYRTRFRGDGTAANPGFIIPGEGPGTAMPASRRMPNTACAGYWEFGDCPRPDFADAQGVYKWGDGTSWLGHYYDVLALEYAMFTDLGLSTDDTLLDLKRALAAYERLDEEAETYFGAAPARDGFFLRDDLQFDHIKRGDGSYTFKRDDSGFAGYECVAGDIACHAPATADGSYTSQDQTIALLHGLGLVAALVPDGVVVEGMDLRAEARGMAHRMTMALREHGWKVTDPTGEHPPDAWGGNALGFSNHIAKATNAICGDDFGVDDYRTLLSRTAGEAAWDGLQAIWGLTPWFNRVMAFMLAAVDGSWDGDKIARKAMANGSDFYAMTYAIMHGETLPEPWSDWRVEAALDAAPCGGPCIGSACAVAGQSDEVSGWRGESRILQPGDSDGSRHVPDAQFNGMDYLATYAAYYVYKHGHVGFAVPDVDGGGGACAGRRGLDAILAAPHAGDTYDPSDACAARDMATRFCGRPFATWLDDAYGGKVDIITGGLHWQCAPGAACVLADDGIADTSGDDLVIGGPEHDDLEGGDGNDCLVGLGGDDILEGNQGYDTLDGGEGNDQLYGESGNLVVIDGENDILWGGAGNDTLKGGPGNDILVGGEGDDELVGDGGDDSLDCGPGNDSAYGDLGEDRLRGGDGDDRLDAGFGDDTVWAGPGRDRLDGDLGSDYLDGGTGDDFVRGGMGDDSIQDPGGSDRLCGNGGDDVIWADWSGTDQCLGGGWLFGGKDEVHGCDDETAPSGDCDKGAYDAW